MNRKELHSQIDTLLDKLAANNTMLKTHEGKFSQLETDLLRKQCIELYDAINQLHLANMMDKNIKPEVEVSKLEVIKKEPELKKTETKPEPEAIKENKIVDPVVSETLLNKEPESIEIIEEKEVVKVIEQKSKPTFDAPKFVPIVEKPAPVIAPPKAAVIEEKSVLDKISETKSNTTLHETISSKKEENELSHRFANSKIAKIKDAIDISKRFEMQSNLFGGDSNAYNISISELEIAGDKESALELFNRFSTRYHWKADNELALELKSFIYRRY